MTETTVVHWEDRPAPGEYVYVGRKQGGLFGNPFWSGSRERNIDQFRKYFYERLHRDIQFGFEVGRLKGKVLVCHCKPMACHADIIAEYLNGIPDAALDGSPSSHVTYDS